MPGTTYIWKRYNIPESSRLYIFSDGIYEVSIHPAADTTKILGLDGFIDLLTRSPQPTHLDDLVTQIAALRAEDAPFSDDLSLLEIDFG